MIRGDGQQGRRAAPTGPGRRSARAAPRRRANPIGSSASSPMPTGRNRGTRCIEPRRLAANDGGRRHVEGQLADDLGRPDVPPASFQRAPTRADRRLQATRRAGDPHLLRPFGDDGSARAEPWGCPWDAARPRRSHDRRRGGTATAGGPASTSPTARRRCAVRGDGQVDAQAQGFLRRTPAATPRPRRLGPPSHSARKPAMPSSSTTMRGSDGLSVGQSRVAAGRIRPSSRSHQAGLALALAGRQYLTDPTCGKAEPAGRGPRPPCRARRRWTSSGEADATHGQGQRCARRGRAAARQAHQQQVAGLEVPPGRVLGLLVGVVGQRDVDGGAPRADRRRRPLVRTGSSPTGRRGPRRAGGDRATAAGAGRARPAATRPSPPPPAGSGRRPCRSSSRTARGLAADEPGRPERTAPPPGAGSRRRPIGCRVDSAVWTATTSPGPSRANARPGWVRLRWAASGRSITSVESASSCTRSAMRRLVLARIGSLTAPDGRCVANTRWDPEAAAPLVRCPPATPRSRAELSLQRRELVDDHDQAGSGSPRPGRRSVPRVDPDRSRPGGPQASLAVTSNT